MTINIAYFYPDLLTLYGENGNIKALKYALEKENIKVKITNIYLEDDFNLTAFDFIYIGSGAPSNLALIKKHLLPHKNEFLKYISQNKVMLVTGNALSIFDFLNLYEVSYQENFVVADCLATTHLCQGNIQAFQNTQYLLKSQSGILFEMQKGYGNNSTTLEGFSVNNFYVTSLIGPILARNINLTQYFVSLLIN